MSLPSIQRDNNLTTVYTDKVTLWFSYETLVAFRVGAVKVVSENCWGATTGKHLNTIDGGNKADRLKRAEFEAKYAELTAGTPEPLGVLG